MSCYNRCDLCRHSEELRTPGRWACLAMNLIVRSNHDTSDCPSYQPKEVGGEATLATRLRVLACASMAD